MSIVVTDWASFSQVLPLALAYGVGLEFQEFTQPHNLDEPGELVEIIRLGTHALPELSMHGPFSELVPASRDPLVRQVAEKRFSQACDIAQKTGAQHLILHSGFFPKTYSRQNWIQNASDFWLDFLKEKHIPGLLHLENVYEDDFSTLQELVDRVNEAQQVEALTICLDIGHVNANSSKSFAEWIETLGSRIRYVHLHNNSGLLDDHWRLDKGTIQVSHVLELLQKHSPEATWSVETTVEDIEPSLQWLKRNRYL
jgi:sugar phosphate isomerase/epimerase